MAYPPDIPENVLKLHASIVKQFEEAAAAKRETVTLTRESVEELMRCLDAGGKGSDGPPGSSVTDVGVILKKNDAYLAENDSVIDSLRDELEAKGAEIAELKETLSLVRLQAGVFDSTCGEMRDELEAKDNKLAEVATTLLGVDAMLRQSIAMLRIAKPHRGKSVADILHILRDRVKARGDSDGRARPGQG